MAHLGVKFAMSSRVILLISYVVAENRIAYNESIVGNGIILLGYVPLFFSEKCVSLRINNVKMELERKG